MRTQYPTLVFSLQGNIRKKLDCQPFKCDGNFQKEDLRTNAIGWIGKEKEGIGEKNTAL